MSTIRKNVLVYVERAQIHWHRPGSDFFQCGECGPDIMFTHQMGDVTCKACKRSMHRTKEWRLRSTSPQRNNSGVKEKL